MQIPGSPGAASFIYDSRVSGEPNSGAPTVEILTENGTAGLDDSDAGAVQIIAANYSTAAEGDGIGNLTGETEIIFNISQQLALDADADGILVGDLFNNDSGTTEGVNGDSVTGANSPARENNGTRGVLTFYTIILEDFETADGVPGDSSVDISDPLVNNASIAGDSQDTDLTDLPDSTKTEDTSASLQASGPTINKTIYAINGTEVRDPNDEDDDNLTEEGLYNPDPGDPSIPTPPDPSSLDPNNPYSATVQAGDLITYRIRAELPSANVENLEISDFFPLPVHDVDTDFAGFSGISGFSGGDPALMIGDSIPSYIASDFTAGSIHYGEDFNLHNIGGLDVNVGNTWDQADLSFVFDDNSNSLLIDFADTYQEPDTDDPVTVVLDFLVTLRVYDMPVDDPFLFTNQTQIAIDNSFGEQQVTQAVTFVEYVAPLLTITKGVIATSNNPTGSTEEDSSGNTLVNTDGSTYTEPTIDNDGDLDNDPIDFSATLAGQSGPSISFNGSTITPVIGVDVDGTILHTPLALDANAADVDGGDWVRYGITVENIGGGVCSRPCHSRLVSQYTIQPVVMAIFCQQTVALIYLMLQVEHHHMVQRCR